ncbi:hypothetical protein I3760_08G124400 [Carya illinoinensis]|nr:hypothetical protein I3760_08G124400 [Carya illinoinensis]
MTLGKNFLNFQNLKKRRNRGFCDDRDFVVQWCKAFFCNFLSSIWLVLTSCSWQWCKAFWSISASCCV